MKLQKTMQPSLPTWGVLVASTTPGRYAIQCADGIEVTPQMRVQIYLAGQWITGTILRSRADSHLGIYASVCVESRTTGCYFVADEDMTSPCGLCTGMHVRLIP